MGYYETKIDEALGSASDAAKAAASMAGQVVSIATSAAQAAVTIGIGDAVADELGDTGSAAHAALVSAAGTISDPTIAAQVSAPASLTRAALNSTYAPKRYAHTIVLASDGTGTHTTVSSAFGALTTGARLLVKPRADGQAWAASGPITLPNVDYVTVEGYSRDGASVVFPAGDGFVFDGSRRNTGWAWKTLRIGGAGLDGSGYGINGTGLHVSDRASLTDVRLIAWNRGLYAEDASGGAHYVKLDNLRVSNCTTGLTTLAGAGGTNGWTLTGGEFATCGVGVKVPDAITDAWVALNTGFEGNAQAISWAGSRSAFVDIRMETNTADVAFTATSDYNHLTTGFFNAAKHSDLSVNNTNTVEMRGFSTLLTPVTTETLNTIHPGVTNVSTVPDSAGAAMVCTITPQRLMRLSSLSFAVSASVGNVDIGVADRAGTWLYTSGSTPMAAVNTVQTITLGSPIWLLPRQRYTVALAFDSATGGVAGVTSPLTATFLANSLDNSARSKAAMFPLAGKSLSGLGSTGKTPWIRAA